MKRSLQLAVMLLLLACFTLASTGCATPGGGGGAPVVPFSSGGS